MSRVKAGYTPGIAKKYNNLRVLGGEGVLRGKRKPRRMAGLFIVCLRGEALANEVPEQVQLL